MSDDLVQDGYDRMPHDYLAQRDQFKNLPHLEDLAARLPDSDDVELRRITDVLGPVLDHHALMLSSSLDMLAVDWRSERIVEELERITGLGAPAERLEGIYAELAGAAGPVP